MIWTPRVAVEKLRTIPLILSPSTVQYPITERSRGDTRPVITLVSVETHFESEETVLVPPTPAVRVVVLPSRPAQVRTELRGRVSA